MLCSTSQRPMIDLSRAANPRAVHIAALHFIIGLRGEPRQHPVTRRQIGAWLRLTLGEAIDRALADLMAEGKIHAVAINKNTIGYAFAGA